MLNLEISNQPVYEKFKGGNFIVRRSARYWAGLPCDLVIEQVLMRSLRSTGGLTRGSGISEITRAIRLLSNPICSKYSLVMEENIGVLLATKARISRDKQDTNKIYEQVVDISPFKNDPTLHNIISGITAAESVNVDKFYEIGLELIRKMEGIDVFRFEFKRKDAAKNLSTKITLSKKNDIKCDPTLLFQRLLVVVVCCCCC